MPAKLNYLQIRSPKHLNTSYHSPFITASGKTTMVKLKAAEWDPAMHLTNLHKSNTNTFFPLCECEASYRILQTLGRRLSSTLKNLSCQVGIQHKSFQGKLKKGPELRVGSEAGRASVQREVPFPCWAVKLYQYKSINRSAQTKFQRFDQELNTQTTCILLIIAKQL